MLSEARERAGQAGMRVLSGRGGGLEAGFSFGVVENELEVARQAGSPRSAGVALRTRGMLPGGQRGLDDLREAVTVLQESGARLEHAPALVELGAAMRRANQCAAARAPQRAGLDLARSLISQ